MHRRSIGFCAVLLALCAMLLGQPALPAHADAAPPPPPHGVSLYPSETMTRVQMVAETVIIEAVANRADQVPYAKVDATFQMHNNGEAEEQMQVHYPLSMLFYDESGVCEFSPYQAIRKFEAWVNGRAVPYTIQREMVYNPLATSANDPLEVQRTCWATFPAVFPAGADVTIRVRFEQEAGIEGYPGYANYLYVLRSGTGWDGPIGSAELIFRAPWQLTDETLLYYYPVDGQVAVEAAADGATATPAVGSKTSGGEIRWQRENFEPDYQDDILVQTINPAVYQEINKGRLLYAGSKHGTAWGRYALAAKQAILGKRGFRDSAWGERLYHESFDAYTHAVELLPWDADWHAGFAELLCTNAAFPTFDLEWSEEERWSACAVQIEAALEINPRHELALRLLDWYGGDLRYLYLENGTPVFPILSVTPPARRTLTPTPTETPLPSATPIPPTKTAVPTRTITPNPTMTEAATPAAVAEVEATSGPTAAPGTGGNPAGGLCRAAFLPVGMILLAGAGMRKRRTGRA